MLSPTTDKTREVQLLEWDSWGAEQLAHFASVWEQGRPFAEQVEVGQECAPVR
jgi:hypothetical protein